MVKVQGGTFVMGNHPNQPIGRDDLIAQIVEVRSFYMDATTVTNEAFCKFRKETGYKTESEKFGWSFVLELHATERAKAETNQTVKDAPHWLAVQRAHWRQPFGPGSGIKTRLNYPVVHVSFNDALAFCKWANKRLPTETEWEYAARGKHVGVTAPMKLYPWGNVVPSNASDWKLNVWQGDFPRSDAGLDGYIGLAPADAYETYGAGLHNMLGNVWEWTSTLFSKSSQQRVLRGGSYLDSVDGAFNHEVTVSTRMGNTADSAADNVGFRCAKSVPGGPHHKPRGSLTHLCFYENSTLVGWPRLTLMVENAL